MHAGRPGRARPGHRWIALVTVVAALLPALVSAQPAAPRVVVIEPVPQDRFDAFYVRLRALGYENGRNVRLELVSASGQLDRIPTLIADVVATKPDIVVALTTPVAVAVKRATTVIPVVAFSGDHVSVGLVESVSRPGGNITGVTNIAPDLMAKRLAMMKQIVPRARRVGLLYHAGDPIAAGALKHSPSG